LAKNTHGRGGLPFLLFVDKLVDTFLGTKSGGISLIGKFPLRDFEIIFWEG